MSSRRSYSKEFRSYYSRSSSYDNNRSNSSYRRRPLSSLLIERDFSPPSLALDDRFGLERRSRKFLDDFDRRLRSRFNDDDFDRRFRSRFDDDFFDEEFFRNNSLDFERNIPLNPRRYNNSSSTTRNIPIQYTTASTNRREKVYKKIDDNNNNGWSSNSFNNDNFKPQENRISTDDWPQKQECPTRKRTSMTIFVRQPRVQYSDVPDHQRTTSTSNRTNYY